MCVCAPIVHLPLGTYIKHTHTRTNIHVHGTFIGTTEARAYETGAYKHIPLQVAGAKPPASTTTGLRENHLTPKTPIKLTQAPAINFTITYEYTRARTRILLYYIRINIGDPYENYARVIFIYIRRVISCMAYPRG